MGSGGVRGTGQLRGTGFLGKGQGKPGSNGPGKKASGGPSKSGSNGPGKKASGGPGKNQNHGNGPDKNRGKIDTWSKAVLYDPGASVNKVGNTVTISEDWGKFIDGLLESKPAQVPGQAPTPAPVQAPAPTPAPRPPPPPHAPRGPPPAAPPARTPTPTTADSTVNRVTENAAANRVDAPPSDVQALKEDIARALGKPTSRLDGLFQESGGARWSVSDLKSLKDVIDSIPPADRLALVNTTFERTGTLPSEDGRPNYGHAEFSRSDFQDKSVIKIADIATGLDAAGNATGPNVVGQVTAHELGHIVQGDGRWNSNEVREFGKLSHWVRQGPPETLVNGYDEYFRTVDFESRDYAKNSTNFVSDYAKESAVEDFAESYRVYLSNPGELMAKAPDKFLYLNAQSRKYTPEQVAGFANVMGVDLPFVMAGMGKSNLRPDTLEQVAQKNGLEVPLAGTGSGDAIAMIQEKALEPAFALKLKEDPRAALGAAAWSKLSAKEQALLEDDAYVNKLLAVTAANKTTPADTVSDGDVQGWKGFLGDILLQPPTDPLVLAAFTGLTAQTPEIQGTGENGPGMVTDTPPEILEGQGPEAKVRYDYLWDKLHEPQHWQKLSPAMQQMFDSDNGKKFIAQMASDKNNLDLTKLAWTNPTGGQGQFGRLVAFDVKKFDNIKSYINTIGPADIEALSGLVKRGITDDEASHVGRANQVLAAGGTLPTEGHIPAL